MAMDFSVAFILVSLVTQARTAYCSSAQLTSIPPSVGDYCSGPVSLKCVGTGIASAQILWLNNGTEVARYAFFEGDVVPHSLPLTPEIQGVTGQITNVSRSQDSADTFDVTSVILAEDAALLDGWSVSCAVDRDRTSSDTLNIRVRSLLPPAAPITSSCSISYDRGNIVSLKWPPSFTSQHAVERYRVSVSPDPSSCSSDQVSLSQVYTCPGLNQRTSYTFSVSAINCRDQEGAVDTFKVMPDAPSLPVEIELMGNCTLQEPIKHFIVVVRWKEHDSQQKCSEAANYTVRLAEANSEEAVESIVFDSDSCTEGLCSATFSISSEMPISGKYNITVSASTVLGTSSSGSASIDIAVRLTKSNIAYVVAGVLLTSVAIAVCIVMVVLCCFRYIAKKGQKKCRCLVIIFHVVCGILAATIPAILWIVFGFYVNLQDNVCSISWQSTRDHLAVSFFIISVFGVVAAVISLIAVLAIFFMVGNKKEVKKKESVENPYDILAHSAPSRDTTDGQVADSSISQASVNLYPNCAYDNSAHQQNQNESIETCKGSDTDLKVLEVDRMFTDI